MGELSVIERAVEEDGPEQPGRSRGGARMSRRAQAWLIVLCSVAVVIAGTVGVLGLIQHRISSELSYIDDPFAEISDRPTIGRARRWCRRTHEHPRAGIRQQDLRR